MSIPKGIPIIGRAIYIYFIVITLFMGIFFNVEGLAAFTDYSEEKTADVHTLTMRRTRNYGRYDPVKISPHQCYYPPLQVKDPDYSIPWGNSRFRCFFKEKEVALKVEVRKAWITYEFVREDVQVPVQASIQGKSVTFSEVGPGVDVRYTVEDDHVLEEVIVYESPITEVVQKVVFEGVTPVKKEKGIYFTNGEKFLFGIPPPVMYELGNKEVECTGLHYELEDFDGVYYLRKVIDEEGLKWLMDSERDYPVVIDATTQSFEDPWESSGLQPYQQYFGNLSEYVSPTSGALTVKQTDFYLPGKGLDVALERVYTTPAVFSTGCRGMCTEEGSVFLPNYEDGPYSFENECPPIDVGNGWQLNFPWIGSEYIHFLDGTMYKKKSENHVGHHFTFADSVLTTNVGVQYHFSSGAVTSVTDTDGNMITFGYSNGHLTTITDTMGRVITFSYNDKGQLTQIGYGSYTVTYSYSLEALASVTDPLGRVTHYSYDQRNNWLLTKISYPTGGSTSYAYSYFSQEVEPPDPAGCFELRKYHVTDQAVYSPDLVRHTCYTYQGDFDGITETTTTIKNEQNLTKLVHKFVIDTNGLVTSHITKNAGGTQLQRVDYTHSDRKEVIQEDIYRGTSYAYTQKYCYDSWGNLIYKENGEGVRAFYSYAHTDSENVFRDCDGNIPEFSNRFFDNSIPSSIHTALVGSVRIQDDRVIEMYCRYNSTGHLLENYQVFQMTADYSVFSGTFDENGQTNFSVDLTGGSLEGDAVLKITGLPNPNEITKTETHSKHMYCTWLNQGYWQGTKFYAKYMSKGWPPEPGYEPIGPFLHYPGTTGYKSYTKWVSGYTQYVKTTYTEPEDKYPHQVEYRLTGDWSVITTNLESNTIYCSIPVEELINGHNTLYFKEPSSWVTKFDWALYVPHAVAPIEEVSTEFIYDSYGNLTSITDPSGNTTTLEYDTQYHAYLNSITNALNHTVSATYDFTRGFVTSVTDAKGYTTSFEYDILGRVTKKIHPDLTELEAVYDDQNNTVTIYDELNHYTINYYDGVGRLTKSEWYISQSKLTETYTYSYLNNLKTVTDPGGHTYSYEYDPLGRPTRQFNPDSTYREIQYDDVLNSISVFDETQHKTEYCYDWTGHLLWVKEYTDLTNYYLTEYTYDSLGHLTSCTDANGNTTGYSYDSLFGVTKVTYPDSTTAVFSYDNAGNVLQRTDPNGTTTFTYNALSQLINVVYPDSSSVSFEYDLNGNRILMADSEGTTSYSYDERNRLLSETRTIEGQPYTVSYQYDAASNLISMMYPDQSTVTFEYDSLNRLTAISGYAECNYNANSLLTSMTYSNGVATTYQYDSNDRPVTIHAVKEGVDLLRMNYSYDPVSNITQLEYSRQQSQEWVQSTETFQYDHLDRLVSAQGDYGLQSYSYDPVGNRLSLNDLYYTHNNMNELLSISDGTVFTYDENGNTLSKTDSTDTWSYTYDTKNQLIQVEKNQQLLSRYSYDGDGHRIKKTEWSEDLQEYQTLIYIYSGSNVIYEKNLDTDQEALYIYGPTDRIAKKVNGLTDYYHTDQLGSPQLITDESGNVVTEVTYEPFGEDAITGEESSYLYTGKEKDTTKLYYSGARYYDPKIGRFTTKDPLTGKMESPQTQNQYVYCLNNPLKYVDPQGMDCEFVILPDGTISYEMAEIYNILEKALGSLSEEDWQLINEYLSSSDLEVKMEAVKMILDAAGIEYEDSGDLLTIEIDGKPIGIMWKDLGGFYGEFIPTITRSGNIIGGVIYLNPSKVIQGGDLFLTLGHELVHAYHNVFHWDIIRSMSMSVGRIYSEYTAYSWSISIVHSVPYVTPSHVDDIITVHWKYRTRWISWTMRGELLC